VVWLFPNGSEVDGAVSRCTGHHRDSAPRNAPDVEERRRERG